MLLLVAGWAPATQAQDLLLKDARMLDPTSETMLHASILIRGDTLAAILDEVPSAFAGEIVELAGKWVLPGLHDMHVHSYGNGSPAGAQMFATEGSARRMLYAGVTGFLDLFSQEESIFALRERQRSAGLLGADIYAAGPILTCPGGHGTELGVPTRTVRSPDEARLVVADLASRKPDVIKLVYTPASARFPSMDRPTMEALVEAAREHGLKSVAHVESWDGVRDVVRAGVTAITHLPTTPVPHDVIVAMKERGTYVIPTLTQATELANLIETPALLDAPLLAALTTADFLAPYRDPDAFDPAFLWSLKKQRDDRAGVLATVRTLAENGIRVMAGTDAGIPGTFQGYSLHRELALLVEAGLTPWQALATATTTPGGFLGESVGVQPGDRANLVVLNASPLEDIRHTQDIAMVIYHGQIVERSRLVAPSAAGSAGSERAGAGAVPLTQALLDDFEDEDLTSTLGTTWRVYRDAALGGKSTVDYAFSDGLLRVTGQIAPGAGSLGFIELMLPLDEHDAPRDVTPFDGVRVRIRVTEGEVLLKLRSPNVTNFDYHAVILPASTAFQELVLPFSAFRQLWSAPVPWTGRQVAGITLSIGGTEAAPFAFEIDELAFFNQ